MCHFLDLIWTLLESILLVKTLLIDLTHMDGQQFPLDKENCLR